MKIAIPKSKIIMKDKSEVVISREQGNKLQDYLSGLSNHVFIKIPELGKTITTAEIREVIDFTDWEYSPTSELPEPELTEEQEQIRKARFAELAAQAKQLALQATTSTKGND